MLNINSSNHTLMAFIYNGQIRIGQSKFVFKFLKNELNVQRNFINERIDRI